MPTFVSRLPVVFALVTLAAINYGCAPAKSRDKTDAQSNADTGIPCQPEAVLKQVCQQCHGSPLKNNAPFALVTYDDVHAPLDGAPTYVHMKEKVEAGEMPFPPVTISDVQKQILLDWLNQEAPRRGANEVCQ